MKHRFKERFQVPFGDFLGDAVSNRGYSQWPRSASVLWNVNTPDWWRKVSP